MTRMTLTLARTLIDGALAEARRQSFKPMGLVVVDAAGQVVASAREDGASALRLEIAEGKAAGSIGMGVNCRALAVRTKEVPVFLAAALHPADRRGAGGRRQRRRDRCCRCLGRHR